jgi:hypothetical protein
MCENCLVWEKNFLELIINLQLAVLSWRLRSSSFRNYREAGCVAQAAICNLLCTTSCTFLLWNLYFTDMLIRTFGLRWNATPMSSVSPCDVLGLSGEYSFKNVRFLELVMPLTNTLISWTIVCTHPPKFLWASIPHATARHASRSNAVRCCHLSRSYINMTRKDLLLNFRNVPTL